jgi:ribosomal protein S19
VAVKYRRRLIVAPKRVITPIFVDRVVYVYSGKLYQNFLIKRNMVGYKFGEFLATKRIGHMIHLFGRKKKVGAKSGRRK